MTTLDPRRGKRGARLIWWPLLQALVAVGLTLTGLFVSSLGALNAIRSLARGLPVVGVISGLMLVPLYLVLVMLYGVVFIAVAGVSLFALRQGLRTGRPKFVHPSSRPGSEPIQHVDGRVRDVD